MELKEVIKWEKNYDQSTYPYGIYQELVVEGLEHPGKLELLGAWKTACLRLSTEDSVYLDKSGNAYSFTNRWKEDTPVGYNIWKNLSEINDSIQTSIPNKFPLTEPPIVYILKSLNHFGFIWSIFVLHCFNPRLYPLYDQHVYRAFRYIVSKGHECPKNADKDWNSYLNYRQFFIQRLNELKIEFWRLDKALWAFGKSLKKTDTGPYPVSPSPKIGISPIVKLSIKRNKHFESNEWLSLNTLGGKSKPFKCKLNSQNCLTISRMYQSGKPHEKVITQADLTKINTYIERSGWMDLANNVEKLRNGTEKEGFGWFLYNILKWTVEEAQLSSHLGALFVNAGIWQSNGKRTGIRFKKNNEKWEEKLALFFKDKKTDNV